MAQILTFDLLSPEVRARLHAAAWKRWEAVAEKEWSVEEWTAYWEIECARQMREQDKAWSDWWIKNGN